MGLMVTVPTNKTGTVQTRAARPTYLSDSVPQGAFDNGASGLVQAGQMVGDLADKASSFLLQMKQEDNETDAKEADSRIAERIRRITLGGDPNDPDYQPGYMATQGKTAMDSFGSAEEAVRAAVREELDAVGDSNTALRNAITSHGDRRINAALNAMTEHASTQRLAHQERASLGREAQAVADASANWGDPQAVQQAMGVVQAEVLDRAEAAGMSDDETAAVMAEHVGITAKSAFDAALVAGDVTTAQSVFSRYADKMDGATRTTMAQSLAEDVALTSAQELADEIWNDPQYGGNALKMMAAVRERTSGKTESTAVAIMRGRIEEFRSATRFGISMKEAVANRNDPTRSPRMQTLVQQVQEELGSDAPPSLIRNRITELSKGKDREYALKLYQTELDRERGDATAAWQENNREAVAEGNALVEGWLAENLTTEEIRANIISIDDVAVQAAADQFYTNSVQSERADENERIKRQDREAKAEGQRLVEDWIDNGVDRDTIRDNIFNIEDEKTQEAADMFYSRYLSSARGDTAEDRLTNNQEVLGKAQLLADQVYGDAELDTPAKKRKALREMTKDDPKVREAAETLLARNIAVERGDVAYTNSIESAARARLMHLSTLDEKQRKEEIRQARVQVYGYLYGDGDGPEERTVRQFRQANPQAYTILAQSGLVDDLVLTERRIAEGKLYANSSDGETYVSLIQMLDVELAKQDAVAYRAILTEQEYNKAVAAIERAKRYVKADAESRTQIDFGRSELARLRPTWMKVGASAPRSHREAMVEVQASMDAWIDQKTRATGSPTNEEIRREAARLMLPIQSGSSWNPFGGIGSRTAVGGQVRTLDADDLSSAYVPVEDITDQAWRGIQAAVQSRFTAGSSPSEIPDEELEKLAGAWAVGDVERFDRIMEELGAVRRETR